MPTGLLPERVYSRLTDLRMREPTLPLKLAKSRRRRKTVAPDGKLALVAVDHPARMVTSIGGDPLRMADRRDLLERTLRVVACSPMDGVLASPDVMDELFMLESMSKKKFLEEKVLVGSTNRGGLAGAKFELDDSLTGYTAEGAARMRLDGAKFLLRMDMTSMESAKTLELCSSVVRECAEVGFPLFLELLTVSSEKGKLTVEKDAEKLARLVGVATALGDGSGNLWLKLPYVEGFEMVARATTCPILLLGGEPKGGLGELFGQVHQAMKSSKNVRGVMMGRNVLYPKEGDPKGVALAVDAIVHHGASAERALKIVGRESGKVCRVFDA